MRFIIGPVSERPIGARPRPSDITYPTRNLEDIDMILTDGQQVELRAVFTSRAGNPVPVENVGRYSWTTDAPGMLTLTDRGDGSCLVVTTGALGAGLVTLRNDFNDDGTEDYQGSIAIDVVAGDVGGVAIAAGEPSSRFDTAEPAPAPEPDPLPPLPDVPPEAAPTTPDEQFPSPGQGGDGEATPPAEEPAPANPDEGFPTTP